MRLEPLQTSQAAGSPSTIPASLRGIDQASPLNAMRPDSAIRLVNFIPRSDGLHVRAGQRKWADGLGHVVSLLTFSDHKVFAASGGSLTEVRHGVKIPQLTGMLSDRWQGDTLVNAGARFLVAANGLDGPRVFDGTSWRTCAITGIDPTRWCCPVFHQRRMFFGNGDEVCYLGTGAIGGPAKRIPIKPYLKRGGRVVGLASMLGSNERNRADELVVLTSEGEILVYSGTDPDTAATWSQRGVWTCDKPMGWRPMSMLGGQPMVLTTSGLFRVPDMLAKPQSVRDYDAITTPVQDTYGGWAPKEQDANWQAIESPTDDGLLIVNLPDGNQVARSATGGWTELKGCTATAWAATRDHTFRATADGEVWHYGAGHHDDGQAIEALAVSAYSRLARGRKVKIVRARPDMTSVPVKSHVSFLADYAKPKDSYPAPIAEAGAPWGTAWDAENRPFDTPPEKNIWDWRTVSGQGHAIAGVFSVRTKAPLIYRGMDLIIGPGGMT